MDDFEVQLPDVHDVHFQLQHPPPPEASFFHSLLLCQEHPIPSTFLNDYFYLILFGKDHSNLKKQNDHLPKELTALNLEE